MSEKASGEISVRQLIGYIKTALGLKYTKPASGIPASDLASAVQTSLGKADTALQTAPVSSVNNKTGAVTLTASDVGAGTYSKPSGGIPASDLAVGVIPDISGKQDAPLIGSVGDSTAADYVTPTQVYNALLAGKDVIINYSDMDFSGIYFTAWSAGLGVVAASIVSRFASVVTLTGTISNNSWSFDSVALVDGNTLAGVAFSGSYTDLTNKPTIPTVPTNVSAFTNDSGYQNAQQVQTAIANLQTKSITDTGGYFTTDTVDGALQEIGAELAGINTLIGTGVIT